MQAGDQKLIGDNPHSIRCQLLDTFQLIIVANLARTHLTDFRFSLFDSHSFGYLETNI